MITDNEKFIEIQGILSHSNISPNECIKINNLIIELSKENKQFKDNWDKLKEWLESNWEESQDIWFVKIINKMQELEQGSDKE